MDLVTELNDVFAFLHFNREQQARVSIVANHKSRVLVSSFHVGEVADIDGLPRTGDIHKDISDLIFRREQAGSTQRNLGGAQLQNGRNSQSHCAAAKPARLEAGP